MSLASLGNGLNRMFEVLKSWNCSAPAEKNIYSFQTGNVSKKIKSNLISKMAEFYVQTNHSNLLKICNSFLKCSWNEVFSRCQILTSILILDALEVVLLKGREIEKKPVKTCILTTPSIESFVFPSSIKWAWNPVVWQLITTR